MAKGSWILLDTVVYDYLTESEQGENKFFKLWNICFRGMEQLGIDFFYEIKTVILQIDSTKTAKLPHDFANYSKIGCLNSFGQIVPFTYNNSLTLFAATNPERLTRIQSDSYYNLYQPESLCYYNYWDGYGYGNMYGIPSGGYQGTFRIDEPNQVIVFENEFTYNSIALEYVALPKEGESYYVPSIFREALIAWMAWKDINSAPLKRAVNLDKEARRRDFGNERRLARARYKPFHLMEAYQWNLQTQRLTIKM